MSTYSFFTDVYPQETVDFITAVYDRRWWQPTEHLRPVISEFDKSKTVSNAVTKILKEYPHAAFPINPLVPTPTYLLPIQEDSEKELLHQLIPTGFETNYGTRTTKYTFLRAERVQNSELMDIFSTVPRHEIRCAYHGSDTGSTDHILTCGFAPQVSRYGNREYPGIHLANHPKHILPYKCELDSRNKTARCILALCAPGQILTDTLPHGEGYKLIPSPYGSFAYRDSDNESLAMQDCGYESLTIQDWRKMYPAYVLTFAVDSEYMQWLHEGDTIAREHKRRRTSENEDQ